MSKKLGQEPAFSGTTVRTGDARSSQPLVKIYNSGMSKRFYAACAAMQGTLANEQLRLNLLADSKTVKQDPDKYLIKYCYHMADNLLKQEHNGTDDTV